MSKLGSLGRGVYYLIAFLVNSTLKISLNLGLVFSVGMTIYAVSNFSKEALKQRKEVLDLIYWRDPKKSGIALGAILTVLFVLTRFPLITVLSYSGLAVLTGTVGFRVIKAVEAQIKKTDGANPFQPYLEQDLSIPQERVREQVDVIVEHAQCLARQLRRLFLVENIVDSVKFGLLLWSFTYIGAWFSGVTLVFLSVIAIFSVPKIYETYQEPIDAQLAVVKGHIDNVTNILEEKLPFLKRAVAEVEKKEQ